MDVEQFEEIEHEFHQRVAKIVWCTMTTVGPQGRPRARMMHPIWEGSQGWVATREGGLKARHLAANPFVSLCYWDPDHRQVYAECRTLWVNDASEKKRIWELYGATDPPLGYDLTMIWSGLDDPNYGVLRLDPWRIEVSSIHDMGQGKPPLVWRAKG
jgi:general stress protein 26